MFLKFLLLEGLQGPGADAGRLLDGLADGLASSSALDCGMAEALSALRCHPLYRARLLELARDAARSEPLAPEICLCPSPLTIDTLPGRHRHAVVFAASAGFSHEFYPLAVDACSRDAERHGEMRLQLLGVHADWLDEASHVRRAIYLEPERNRLVETDWDRPFMPDSVQFLSLGDREQSHHAALAARFQCPQANHREPAALADDKAATLAHWRARGLDVPESLRVDPSDFAGASGFLRNREEFVAKPNRGTEGRQVTLLAGVGPEAEARLNRALEACRDEGAVLLQERRDGVAFRCPETGALHTLALRVNVVFDGRRHRAVSGYAQTGADSDQPASRGRGGRIRTLAEVLAHLARRRSPSAPVPAPDARFWDELVSQAEQAAAIFPGLLLAGLDVLLDVDEWGTLLPVFLEANPRPAGLCHSRLWSALPSSADPPGVGPALWDGLAALCAVRSPQNSSEHS